MLAADILHLFHLGTGRDLLGSCLKVLVKMRYFEGSSIEASLGRATGCLKRFAKSRGYSLALRRLTKQNLTWASDSYPEVKCKGFDTFILLAWLVEEVGQRHPTSRDAATQMMLDEMCTSLWSANKWLEMLSHADMFLTDGQQLQKVVVGRLFLCSYLRLAQRAVENNQRLWRVRPKIHSFTHLVEEDRPGRQNPHYASTWMDEDWVKRVMRVKKKTHRRTAPTTTLQRWLLALGTKLQYALATMR